METRLSLYRGCNPPPLSFRPETMQQRKPKLVHRPLKHRIGVYDFQV
jgi:hypothetical protein